ncbi:ABC transporter substrate-binding protein [Yinghuangia soli]|uniref:ABC transporter substrate-binding protein n=1 Tax=Yinghuangia soli TaxID=2908204 RepID=A0AA41U4I5_9ACTN|nr:ABC transporter substrate-binding protein [Yinghuangia soli]MCF2532950.1 ABC transporter substrate-binding protein [Yinghuangia soli]
MPVRITSAPQWIAGAAVLAIAATGCSGGGGGAGSAVENASAGTQGSAAPAPAKAYDCFDAAAQGSAPDPNAGAAAVDPAGVFSASATEPEDLIPGNNLADPSNYALGMLFRGLIGYDATSGKPYPLMMASCTTTDATAYTISVKPGWTFHDGTQVTAKSYADAWNWAKDPANKAAAADLFADVASVEAPDETTLRVKLAKAKSSFPAQLGLTAYAPLPASFFADPKAFSEAPVGNGPFAFDSASGGWERGTAIHLKRYDAYSGPDKARAAGVKLQLTRSTGASTTPNVASAVPVRPGEPVKVAGGTVVRAPWSSTEMLNLPMYDAAWSAPGKEKVRQGLSLAIDRKAILERFYPGGAGQPATDWLAPGVPGQGNACGELCAYDPARAKQLVTEGGGLPGGKVTLAFAADGGRTAVFRAICDSIDAALGAGSCVLAPEAEFGALRTKINAKQMTGLFRGGWVGDYPSPENFLAQMFQSESKTNDSAYTSSLFDKAVDKAKAAPDPAKAAQAWTDAQAQLALDMPSIPLWSYERVAAHGPMMAKVELDTFGVPIWTQTGLKK